MEQTQSIENLINDIDKEQSVLPEFQRDFVWEEMKTLDLFDSIVKDIFIGAIIYGIPSFEITTREIDTRERKRKGKKRKSLTTRHFSKERILDLQKLDKGKFKLILDGQQRITSIYRAIKGIDNIYFIRKKDSELDEEVLAKKPAERKLEELLYCFDTGEDDNRLSIQLCDVWKIMKEDYLEEEIKDDFFKPTAYYTSNFDDEDFNEKLEFRSFLSLKSKISDLFKAEKLLSYYLLDMSLDKFVLFFERSNSRGVQLNFIDILTAKLYEGFNLKEKLKEFEKEYSEVDIIPELIVRAIAYMISKERFIKYGKSIEIHRTFILTELNSEHFNTHWDSVVKWYKNALDFLYKNNFILSQSWIPYPNMLIPLIIFQKELNNGFDQMTESQSMFIKQWYWSSIFSQRYTGSSNEKIIQDSNVLSIISDSENKITDRTYFNKLFKSVLNSPQDLFSYSKKQNAIYKGILNFVNYSVKGYLDWNNTNRINFNSDIDDHHIFPKDYILKKSSEDSEERDFIDCVVNRTLIPKITNIKIGNKAPSIYMQEIKNDKNESLEESLKSHYIETDIINGGYDNDFVFFLEYRADEIYKALDNKVFSQNDEVKKRFYIEPVWDKSISVFARYYKTEVNGSFNPKSGSLSYNGKLYDSPSGAGIQAKIDIGAPEDTTVNGWRFWKFIDPTTNEEKYISELREMSVEQNYSA
nr:DUF262 domain-containing protein [uncultured Draconibacterium sp.]